MKLKIIENNRIIKISSNKSHFQRVLIASILSKKKIIINNYTYSEDNMILIKCFIELGYSIDIYDDYMIVNNQNRKIKKSYTLNIEDSGFAIRVLPIILSSENAKIKILYNKRIYFRNIKELEIIFNQFNLSILITQDYLEFYGGNQFKNNLIYCNCSISSQYATGLLFYMAFIQNIELKVNNPTSKNYLDLTLDVIQQFGISISNDNYTNFYINRVENINNQEISIEGDWSGASNLIVLALIMGKGIFANLSLSSKQSDKIIIELLLNIGAKITYIDNILIVEKSKLKSFDFDADNCPDLIPVLIPLAILTNRRCIIRNVNRLQYKESNRLKELLISYQNMKANITYNNNTIIIEKSKIELANLNSQGDHRLAMSYAIAMKSINSKIQLIEDKSVNKSYPDFYEQIKKIEIYE